MAELTPPFSDMELLEASREMEQFVVNSAAWKVLRHRLEALQQYAHVQTLDVRDPASVSHQTFVKFAARHKTITDVFEEVAQLVGYKYAEQEKADAS